MQISVHLYGPLRDYLPREQNGRSALTVAPAATVADVLATLAINRPVTVAVNDSHESAETHPLQDGDHLIIFEQSAGG